MVGAALARAAPFLSNVPILTSRLIARPETAHFDHVVRGRAREEAMGAIPVIPRCLATETPEQCYNVDERWRDRFRWNNQAVYGSKKSEI
jgi:hypothetical protein